MSYRGITEIPDFDPNVANVVPCSPDAIGSYAGGVSSIIASVYRGVGPNLRMSATAFAYLPELLYFLILS